MNTSKAMNIVSWIIFCLDLIFRYGPKLYALIMDIYRMVERKALGSSITNHLKPSSEQKRVWFRREAKQAFVARKGVEPTFSVVNRAIEDAWRRANGRHARPMEQDARELGQHEVAFAIRQIRLMDLEGLNPGKSIV